MAHSASDSDEAVHATLALLEIRLRRLEFLLTGSSDVDGLPDAVAIPMTSDETVRSRLAKLEADLDRLRRLDGIPGSLVRELERIYLRSPEFFSSQDAHSPEDLSTLASVVLSHATNYPETASRLSSLQTLQVPHAAQSAKLSDLRFKVEECSLKQEELDHEVRDLRERSARCLEWWVKTGIVGLGDLFEEWDDRVVDTERQLMRLERRRKEEEGYVRG